MPAGRLPARIASTMVLTVMLFLVVFALALQIIRSDMDQREAERTTRLVRLHIDDMQADLAEWHSDYNLWTDSWRAISAQDWDWVYENYASTADAGELLSGVVLFGGPLPEPVAWAAGQGAAPQRSFLPKADLEHLSQALTQAMAGGLPLYQTALYRDNQAILVVVGQVRPAEDSGLADPSPDDLPLSVFVRALSQDMLNDLADGLGLTGLHYVPGLTPGALGLPLVARGIDPPGGLVWQPARPGTEMLISLGPVLAMVVLTFVLLAAGAAYLARAAARALVQQQCAAKAEARTDILTGLPNRLAFSEHMRTCDRQTSGLIGLLFLDLNGFKRINDSIGHDAGDVVIRDFAARLADAAGPEAMVARIGGDEFVIVMKGTVFQQGEPFQAKLLEVSRRVSRMGFDPIPFQGHRLFVSASQGLAIGECPRLSSAELVRRADLAMFTAKVRREAEAVIYTDDLDRAQREDQHVEKALRLAMEQDEEIFMYYQPIICSRTGNLTRVEALARWKSASLGQVPPDRFIAVAEKTGLIAQLGRLLLCKIAQDIAGWPHLSVSLNVSPHQLLMPGFAEDMLGIFAAVGVAPQRVEVELTEGTLVSDPDLAAFCLDSLREMGFTTALDDFGAGFSSIGYLRRMSFDRLKIDRSFVGAGLSGPGPDQGLIRSIVLLGHSIGKTVVCEGVETAEQARVLTDIGCDFLQGYLYGRPMPMSQLSADFPPLAAQAAT